MLSVAAFPHALSHLAAAANSKTLAAGEFNKLYPLGALVFHHAPTRAGAQAPAPLSQTVYREHDDEDVDVSTSGAMFLILPLCKSDRNTFPHITVGRSRNHDVVIVDDTISKFHASLRGDGKGLLVQDEGSRNGTAVNGEPVPKRGEGKPLLVPSHGLVRFGTIGFTYLATADLKSFLSGIGG